MFALYLPYPSWWNENEHGIPIRHQYVLQVKASASVTKLDILISWPTINIRPHIMHFRRLAFSYTEVIY